jgi:hypothetical protein
MARPRCICGKDLLFRSTQLQPLGPRYLRFMRELPVDLPALLWREDATERATLTEATPLLPRIEQEEADSLPFQIQNSAPFRHRRRRGLTEPPSARGPGALETEPGGIPVDGVHNGPRKRKTPSIYLLMGLHGRKCSTSEAGTQSVSGPLGRPLRPSNRERESSPGLNPFASYC